jgi:hypothetical protein
LAPATGSRLSAKQGRSRWSVCFSIHEDLHVSPQCTAHPIIRVDTRAVWGRSAHADRAS